MILNEDFIEDIAQSGALTRGRDYYNRKLVSFFEFGIVKDKFGEEEAVISAVVGSADLWSDYEVEASINLASNKLFYKCSCPAYKARYTDSQCCKHVVAVLLTYIKDGYQRKALENTAIKNRNLAAEKIVKYIEKNRNTGSKKNLRLDITLNKFTRENKGAFEFKIGAERLYVVKNLIEFARAVKTKTPLFYGNNFTLDMKEQRFKKEDLEIVNLILEYAEIKENVEDMMFYSRRQNGADKKLIASNKILSKALKCLSGRKINFYFDDEYQPYPVEIVKENLPITLNFSEKNDKISISKTGEPIPIDDEKTVYFYEKKIYIPEENQALIFGALDNIPRDHRQKFEMEKEEGERVLKTLLPRVGENVKINLSEKITSRVIKKEMNPSIYIDNEEGSIVLEVVFDYEDIKINPLKEEGETPYIIIRDYKKEKNFLNIVEELGFNVEKGKFIIKDEEGVIDFLREDLDKIKNLCEVYYSENFKNMKIHRASAMSSSIRINSEDLLEITFDIPNVEAAELKNILASLKQKKKYHKLKNGSILLLDNNDLRQLPTLVDSVGGDKLLKNGTMTMSKNNILFLDEAIKDSGVKNFTQDSNVKSIIKNIKEVHHTEFKVPEKLDNIMREYQKTGFKWFKTLSAYKMGGILADEMGLGKTLQSISFLASELGGKSSLVVAPTSLIYNWEQEINHFYPELKTIIIIGNKSERIKLLEEVENHDVVITSYPLLTRDIDIYEKIDFKYMLIDGAQKIKNRDTLTTKSVKDIKAEVRFALTDTPIENSLTELWSIFDFVMPGYLFSHRKFSDIYEAPIVKDGDRTALEALGKKIKPFILRRLKGDVIKELPDKIEKKIFVDMTKEQKKLYTAYVKDIKGEIEETVRERGFRNSKFKILAALTRLRQLCCDPSTFVENYNGYSGKYEALEDILEEVLSEKHKVLLFSQFTSVLKNIAEIFHKKKITYKYLDGSVKSKERLEMVEEFNEDSTEVFLISLKAGGTGLNLTSADVVIHFDPWWNPSVENQATDRAHRIGQTNTVQVIKLITKGTIEEKIDKLQEKKKEVINNVLDEDVNENNVLAAMDYEEIKDLFR